MSFRPEGWQLLKRRERRRRPALRLEVPSETSFLGLVRDVTRKMAEVAGFEAKTADQVALAVDEAATNVARARLPRRGRPRGARRDGRRGATSFWVDVVDDGESFDPESLRSLDVRPSRRSAGPAGSACTSWGGSWTP